jgi:hypothetical protein
MLKYLEIAAFIIGLGPKIIEIVNAVEKMLPENKQGAAKLELVKNMVKSTFEGLGNLKVTFDEVWPSVQKMVAAVVMFANSVGLFKKNA